jgi:hypothetical protein
LEVEDLAAVRLVSKLWSAWFSWLMKSPNKYKFVDDFLTDTYVSTKWTSARIYLYYPIMWQFMYIDNLRTPFPRLKFANHRGKKWSPLHFLL